MAVSGILSNYHLSGLPIIYTARADARTGASFHRILLTVTVSSSDGRSDIFQFSTPTSGDEDVDFDISSAIRALADGYQYEANILTYPTYSFTIDVREEWMVDGDIRSAAGGQATQGNHVYHGRISDYSRLYSQWPKVWSTRPVTSPMIAFTGSTLIVPGPAVTVYPSWTAPAVSTVTVAAGPSSVGGDAALPIFGIPAPRDGYELRFINSLGVHENVFLASLPTTEATIQTDRYVIARQETLTAFSRGTTRKHSNHRRYHLIAGPLDQEWQQWYIDEVLMTRWAWLRIGTHYIPCHVLPEDTIQALDRQKGSILTVPITVELDIEGSPALT